ncbi:hypothetical protein BDD12DRAFT_793186 [Trichophaea hybrida]|nr:hypothetical protein BDD12DRAFT_793186 [Trichophaea hybrida]
MNSPRLLLRSLPSGTTLRASTHRPLICLKQCSLPPPPLGRFSTTAIVARPKAPTASTPSSHPQPQPQDEPTQQQFEKKKAARSTTTKSSLRRAAVVSERRLSTPGGTSQTKRCTAYCTAEKYNLQHAATLLRNAGYTLDPTNTGLTDQVIHLQLPISPDDILGDIFIFPSGNIVSWSLPSSTISSLANLITPAAETVFTKDVETEDLEYTEDPRVRKSRVGGDIIILGTAPSENYIPTGTGKVDQDTFLNITLAKIAFSSGLARSTKLAVLESLLDKYLATTSDIPTLLSRGSRLPFTRSFILCKTGELLQFRAQLNLYSELTDSLPDLFWDSRHELGLEGYYDAVGRALDVHVRIRQLNEKLDYASGIVEVLRERLSERHSLGLEWMIIVLIAVEVGFELMRMWREHQREGSDEYRYKKWKEMKEREEDGEWQMWKEERDREAAEEGNDEVVL